MTIICPALKPGARFALLAVVILLAPRPAAASDLYTVNANRPIYSTQKPAPGKALIYLIRPGPRPDVTVRKIKLYADGKFLGLLMANSYITLECEPGRHELIAVGRNAGFLQAEVRADRMYLVIAGEDSDMPESRSGFNQNNVSFATARAGSRTLETLLNYLTELHPIETTPEGVQWEKEHHAKFQEIITKSREKMKKLETLRPEDGFEMPPWQKKA